MLKTHLLSKVSTFALMGLFASVVITPCFAMETEDKEPSSTPTPPVMKEEEKPAPTPQLPKKTPEEMEKERREAIQKEVAAIHKASEEKITPLVQKINQIRQEGAQAPLRLLDEMKKVQEKLHNMQVESEKEMAALTRKVNEIQKEREEALKPFFPELSKTRAQDFMDGVYTKKNLSESDEGLSILTGLPTLKKGNRFLKAAYTYIFNQGVKIEDPSSRKQFLQKNFFVDINSQTRQFRLDALKEFFTGLVEQHADYMQRHVVGMECDGILKQEIKKAFENQKVRIRCGNIETLYPCLHLFTDVKFVD